MQSVLRRSLGDFAPESPLDRGPFHVDPAARVAMMNGELLPLTVREFDLLAFLVKHPRQAFSREELLTTVWGWTLRRPVDGDGARPTAPREDRARPDPADAADDGLGRRLSPRHRGGRR